MQILDNLTTWSEKNFILCLIITQLWFLLTYSIVNHWRRHPLSLIVSQHSKNESRSKVTECKVEKLQWFVVKMVLFWVFVIQTCPFFISILQSLMHYLSLPILYSRDPYTILGQRSLGAKLLKWYKIEQNNCFLRIFDIQQPALSYCKLRFLLFNVAWPWPSIWVHYGCTNLSRSKVIWCKSSKIKGFSSKNGSFWVFPIETWPSLIYMYQ